MRYLNNNLLYSWRKRNNHISILPSFFLSLFLSLSPFFSLILSLHLSLLFLFAHSLFLPLSQSVSLFLCISLSLSLCLSFSLTHSLSIPSPYSSFCLKHCARPWCIVWNFYGKRYWILRNIQSDGDVRRMVRERTEDK